MSEFFDYHTQPVSGKEVVDLYRTGMSYYDEFLSKDPKVIERLRSRENLVGKVVKMSPEQYYQACSDYGFINSHPSVEALKQGRRADTKILDHLKRVLTEYKKRFPMPMLNLAENGQEGLHRMMVIGDMFGWDYKVPVLVVDWADKQRAFDDAKRKRLEKLTYRIKAAVKDALLYKFNNIDELKEQLQWELDRQFKYEEDVSTPVQFELTSDEQTKEFIVSIGAAKYSFDYEDVQFIEPSEEGDLDDVDFEVDDDFLVRYFGDDWRETYPHLKDKFNIKEALEQQDVTKIDNSILNYFGDNVPGEGCVFIHPNGTFINIYPQLDDHEDLCYWLEEKGFENIVDDAEWFVDEFYYIRCRNSLHLTFVQLPISVTPAQLRSLDEWMENKVSSSYLQVEVPTGKWRKYNLDEYFPEDIIKLIKRYFSSGTLYE